MDSVALQLSLLAQATATTEVDMTATASALALSELSKIATSSVPLTNQAITVTTGFKLM